MSIRPRLGAGVPELTAQVARASNPVTFSEDTLASRTGSGPANLATIRAAIIAAIKDAGYLHISEGRRDHTTPAETLRLHSLDQDTNGHSRITPEPCTSTSTTSNACAHGEPSANPPRPRFPTESS